MAGATEAGGGRERAAKWYELTGNRLDTRLLR